MVRQHKLRWFMDRIGKHIYRRGGTCRCIHCQKVLDEGLDVSDKCHVDYLYCCQNEMNLSYSDRPFIKLPPPSK